MAHEVLDALRPAEGETAVDCTLGFGGHAWLMAQRLGPEGRLIGLDVDAAELARTTERLSEANTRVTTRRANFAELPKVLAAEGIEAVDIILADLGVSSMQVDDPARGVHYRHADAPLDMRMDASLPHTAADLLATMSVEELSAALLDLSDEPDHETIAQWIVNQRQVAPIERTDQLSRLVMNAKGLTDKTWRSSRETRYGELHPSARTFQTLRILVNDEIGSLRRLLEAAPGLLRPGGRIGIISFHSGEDGPVKNAFRDGLAAGVYGEISPKVITPRQAEVRANRRSASAKFRWAVKAGETNRQ
jgi:16S rRNA (cytosine1402-N4)-methyltransferase